MHYIDRSSNNDGVVTADKGVREDSEKIYPLEIVDKSALVLYLTRQISFGCV